MKNVSEPSPVMIQKIIECGHRMGCEVTWLQAREMAIEIMGNTANDNPWP